MPKGRVQLTQAEAAELAVINADLVAAHRKKMTPAQYLAQRAGVGEPATSRFLAADGSAPETRNAIPFGDAFRAGLRREGRPSKPATVETEGAFLIDFPLSREPIPQSKAAAAVGSRVPTRRDDDDDEEDDEDTESDDVMGYFRPDRRSVRSVVKYSNVFARMLGEPLDRDEEEITYMTVEAVHESLKMRRMPTWVLVSGTGVFVYGKRVAKLAAKVIFPPRKPKGGQDGNERAGAAAGMGERAAQPGQGGGTGRAAAGGAQGSR